MRKRTSLFIMLYLHLHPIYVVVEASTFFSNRKDRKYTKLLSERLERGGPLLTVKTEANGDSRSTHERDGGLLGSL
jgi:hypothetical protein